MKTSLLFDFTVDKSSNTVCVKREFDAELSLVWDAFTKKEILDQWWAPKPWVSRTKYMDFKAGGRRFYAMVSPEGEEHWSVQQYTSVNPTTNFKFHSAFTDKDGNVSPVSPDSDWDLNFAEEDSVTTVTIYIKHKTFATLEKMIQMGFKEELNKSGAFEKPIVTEITPFKNFYVAEDYHQNYYNENGSQPYCYFVIRPKLEKFEKVFKSKIRH